MTEKLEVSITQGTAAATQPSVEQQQQQTGVAMAVAAALIPAPIQEVCTLLIEADRVSSTVYADIKKAASLAATAMTPGLEAPAQVDRIIALYAPVWLQITDPNTKQSFKNLLWLHADPKAQVTVPVIGAAKEAAQTQIVDAITVLSMSKATITEVSKQIRDIHDAGRAAGGGRKAKETKETPRVNPLPNTGTPAAPVVAAAPVVPGATNPAVATGTLPVPVVLPAPSVAPAAVPAKAPSEVANATFFDELERRLDNPGDMAKVMLALERRGIKCTKAQNVTPAAAATPADATIKLAEMLLESTPAPAIELAMRKAAEAKAAKVDKAKK